MKAIIVTLILLLASATADAVTFTFKNDSDVKFTYRLYWVDHEIEIFKGQLVNIIGGEIPPHETRVFDRNYNGTKFVLQYAPEGYEGAPQINGYLIPIEQEVFTITFFIKPADPARFSRQDAI